MIEVEFRLVLAARFIEGQHLATVEMPEVPLPAELVELGGVSYRVRDRSWNVDLGYSDPSGNCSRAPSARARVTLVKWEVSK